MFINESLRKTLHTKEDENYVTVIMKTAWDICYNYYRQFTYSIIITTARDISGSSPDEVDFLNWPNPSGRTMALGSTQPLTEVSTKNL
jgi:hypothetical protein